MNYVWCYPLDSSQVFFLSNLDRLQVDGITGIRNVAHGEWDGFHRVEHGRTGQHRTALCEKYYTYRGCLFNLWKYCRCFRVDSTLMAN